MNIHAVGVHTARPAEGGCTRGVSAERFETPLVGRAACFWRRGGNPPAPAFPRRGKRERGRSNLLAAAGICLRITPEYRPLTPSPQALTATQKPEFPHSIQAPSFNSSAVVAWFCFCRLKASRHQLLSTEYSIYASNSMI